MNVDADNARLAAITRGDLVAAHDTPPQIAELIERLVPPIPFWLPPSDEAEQARWKAASQVAAITAIWAAPDDEGESALRAWVWHAARVLFNERSIPLDSEQIGTMISPRTDGEQVGRNCL
jgi:hypothetical protein